VAARRHDPVLLHSKSVILLLSPGPLNIIKTHSMSPGLHQISSETLQQEGRIPSQHRRLSPSLNMIYHRSLTHSINSQPTLTNNEARCRCRILTISQMGSEGALTRADDVLIVADGVDLRGRDSAYSLAAVWVAKDNNCGEEGGG
jgi:hypothetical protein